MNLLPGRRVRWSALGAVVGALAIGGIAWADIPDSGVIHGCYATKDGTLRVIDTSAGQSCDTKKEQPLSWNQTGPTGPTGSTGPTEGVNAVGTGGLTPPTTLTNQLPSVLSSELNSVFTTTVSGKLYLSKPLSGLIACFSSSNVWWWITLDGAPIRASLALTPAGSESAQTLVGVTSPVVAAGTHTLSIEAMCESGNVATIDVSPYSGGTATVLG